MAIMGVSFVVPNFTYIDALGASESIPNSKYRHLIVIGHWNRWRAADDLALALSKKLSIKKTFIHIINSPNPCLKNDPQRSQAVLHICLDEKNSEWPDIHIVQLRRNLFDRWLWPLGIGQQINFKNDANQNATTKPK